MFFGGVPNLTIIIFEADVETRKGRNQGRTQGRKNYTSIDPKQFLKHRVHLQKG